MNGRNLASALLAMLCALQLVCLLRAAPAWSPAAIHVLLRAGESVTLGKQELGTPDAALHQLALRRDDLGRWWVRNTNPARMAVLHRGEHAQRMGASALRAGSEVAIGAGQFTVGEASPELVTLRQGSDTWRYDGATLLRNGSLQPACPDASIAARAGALWNRIAPAPLTTARPLLFGGNLHCGNRLGIAYLAPASATLARVEGRLLLSGRAGGDERAPVLVDGADLALGEQPLAGVQAIGLGRTRLQLAQERGMLTLTPQRHVLLAHTPLAPAPQAQLPRQVGWTWQQRAMWTLPLALAALAAASVIGAGILWRWRRASLPAFAAAMLAVAGLAALLLQRAGHAPGVGISMLLGWAALWLCLRAPGRLALATAAGVLLLAVGLLAQLDLGVSAAESSWLRYYQKTVALLALGLGAGTLLRLAAPLRMRMLPQTRLEWLLAALAFAALAALLMQVLFGDETGVFDLQPVEFAKLALTALTAHCLAIGAGWNRTLAQHERPAVRWLRLAAPVLLFAALLALALVQVDDFSPLILLLVWSVAMLLAWSLAARHHGVSAAVAVVVCLAAGAIGYLRLGGAEQLAQAGPGFYADRFMVGSSRVDLQACKLEYSIVSPK